MLNVEQRTERWIKVSIGLMRYEKHMMPLVQQLGRIDTRLMQADETWADRFLDEKLSDEDSTNLHEHITLSFLWLLGAYEFVRTLCDRLRTDMEGVPEDVRNSLLAVKHRFARVRMPLAKMEAAAKFSDQDGPIAYPGLKRGLGVAWQLNPSTVVTRQELSDILLEGLELRRSAFLKHQAAQSRQSSPGRK